jgi:hypothetical protein
LKRLINPSGLFYGLEVLIKRNITIKWKWICKPKKKGGLGLKNLYKFNSSLMCKWWWKLESGSGPWQDLRKKEIFEGWRCFLYKERAW